MPRAYFPDMNPQLMEQMIRAETQELASFPRDARVSREGFGNVVKTLLRIVISKPGKCEDLVVTSSGSERRPS